MAALRNSAGHYLYFCPVVSIFFFFMAALRSRYGHYIFILWFLFSIGLSSIFPHLISAAADWMSTILHTWCGPSANVGFRSETCCTRLASWKWRTQNIAKNSPSAHHRTTLSGHIFATEARIDNQINLLNSNISSTCTYNMVNFGTLKAHLHDTTCCQTVDNRLSVCIRDTTGCQTGCTTGLTNGCIV